jgi:hypothetical protein
MELFWKEVDIKDEKDLALQLLLFVLCGIVVVHTVHRALLSGVEI